MGDPDRVKVLLVTAAASASAGESARQAADLLRLLPDAGVEVALACPAGGDLAALASSSSASGVALFAAEIASGFSPARAGALRPAIDAFAPDIVHAFGTRAAMLARLADPRARERVVYTIDDVHMDPAGSRTRRAGQLRAERRLRSRAAAWICACGSDLDKAEELKILRRERSRVVHPGVALPSAGTGADAPAASSGDVQLAHLSASRAFKRELGLAPGAPLVVSVGAYSEQKDQRILLDAWASARAAAPGAVLALVGSGELEGKLRVRTVALGLGDSVRFVAPRPDVGSLYADADLFVLSSRWEGLPYVVLEAMAYGLPVVSTAVDGIPEAVMNEDAGLLVPARDAGSLASAMRHLLADPERRRAMGASGRARVERHFTLDEMVDGVLRVYGEVVSAGSGRR